MLFSGLAVSNAMVCGAALHTLCMTCKAVQNASTIWQTEQCGAWGVQEVMVELCGGDQPTLPKPAVQRGTQTMLKEVINNTPKAADLVSSNTSMHTHLCMPIPSCPHSMLTKGPPVFKPSTRVSF